MQGWSSPAKAFLEKQESDIHITPLIEEFTHAEAELSAWVHNVIDGTTGSGDQCRE